MHIYIYIFVAHDSQCDTYVFVDVHVYTWLRYIEEEIGEIELISPQQVYDAVYGDDTIQLLDVRTKEEFTDSHLNVII